jgi:UDP-arabinose 4-epimerase
LMQLFQKRSHHDGLYYENNVGGTLSLLRAMQESGIDKIVVSSSCATYGQPDHLPITELTPQKPINPYGMSKLMMENVCGDFERAYGIRSVALRYFNAAGCDPDGMIGERHDPEPHLIPRIFMAQDGAIETLDIMGDDYPTPDGTCIHDYIHVNEEAETRTPSIWEPAMAYQFVKSLRLRHGSPASSYPIASIRAESATPPS